MATRSNIGIVNLDKSITGIYCHWDGYPEYVSKMLLNHYNNVDIVNGLMNLGDSSILSESLYSTTGINLYSDNNRHTFNNPQKGVCVAYGRDRVILDLIVGLLKIWVSMRTLVVVLIINICLKMVSGCIVIPMRVDGVI